MKKVAKRRPAGRIVGNQVHTEEFSDFPAMPDAVGTLVRAYRDNPPTTPRENAAAAHAISEACKSTKYTVTLKKFFDSNKVTCKNNSVALFLTVVFGGTAHLYIERLAVYNKLIDHPDLQDLVWDKITEDSQVYPARTKLDECLKLSDDRQYESVRRLFNTLPVSPRVTRNPGTYTEDLKRLPEKLQPLMDETLKMLDDLAMEHKLPDKVRRDLVSGASSEMKDVYSRYTRLIKERAKLAKAGELEAILMSDLRTACDLFEISAPLKKGEPLDLQVIKQKHTKIVQIHHPDKNNPNGDLDRYMKSVNSYNLLKTYNQLCE